MSNSYRNLFLAHPSGERTSGSAPFTDGPQLRVQGVGWVVAWEGKGWGAGRGAAVASGFVEAGPAGSAVLYFVGAVHKRERRANFTARLSHGTQVPGTARLSSQPLRVEQWAFQAHRRGPLRRPRPGPP